MSWKGFLHPTLPKGMLTGLIWIYSNPDMNRKFSLVAGSYALGESSGTQDMQYMS